MQRILALPCQRACLLHVAYQAWLQWLEMKVAEEKSKACVGLPIGVCVVSRGISWYLKWERCMFVCGELVRN